MTQYTEEDDLGNRNTTEMQASAWSCSGTGENLIWCTTPLPTLTLLLPHCLAPHQCNHPQASYVTLLDYLFHLPYADYHWDCHFSFILIHSHRQWLLSCTTTSWICLSLYDMISFDSLVWYNLLQVRLSLVDAHLPSHSLAYLVWYNEGYWRCTSRTLRP